MSTQSWQEPDESYYRSSCLVSGVQLRWRSRIVAWDGWPDEVRATLERWNRGGRLSFRYLGATWAARATGFPALSFKCTRCAGFFNSSGSTACEFDGALFCDDCMVLVAREETDGQS